MREKAAQTSGGIRVLSVCYCFYCGSVGGPFNDDARTLSVLHGLCVMTDRLCKNAKDGAPVIFQHVVPNK